MSKLKTVKTILYNACLYFTAAVFVILFAANITKMQASYSFLSLGSTALVFVACLLASALNLVWKLDYSAPARTLIHFTGSFLTYAILFILIPKVYTNAAQIAVRSIVFLVLYILIAFIVLIIASIKKNRRSNDSEYESQFGNFFDK